MQENAPCSLLPVIVITGTPGTGKTTHGQLLVEQSPVPLRHINVSELVKEKMLHDGFDEEWQTYVVDEDKVRAGIIPCTGHVCDVWKFLGGRRIGATNRRRWGAHPRLAYVRCLPGAVGRPRCRIAM